MREKKYSNLSLTAVGESEDTSKSLTSLWNAFAIALALIFLILSTQFGSLTQPLVVMFAIPFGFIGVILSLSCTLERS